MIVLHVNCFSQGPTEAERKIEELTRQLEEEMEKQEEEGEYFGKKKIHLRNIIRIFRKTEIIITLRISIAVVSCRTLLGPNYFFRKFFFLTSFPFRSCALFHTRNKRPRRGRLYGNATIAGSHGTIARSKSIILYISLKR